MLVIGILYISHLMIFGEIFNNFSAFAILGTNMNESKEFLTSFLNFKLIIVNLIYLVLGIILLNKIFLIRNITFSKKIKIYMLFLLFIIYIPTAYIRSFQSPLKPIFANKIVNSFKNAYRYIKTAEVLKKDYIYPIKTLYKDNLTFIVIIGESANRNHMHIYGYPRETTPFTEKISELYYYRDVISCGSTTEQVLRLALTFADLKHKTSYITTIFDVFKKAGFKTYWISSQYDHRCLNKYFGIVPLIASKADYKDSIFDLPKNKHYDEFLIPKLRKILKEPCKKKFIIVQLLGSHTDYCKRIPPKRSEMFFKGIPPKLFKNLNKIIKNEAIKKVNCYDTSIKYTDFVLDNIMKLFFNNRQKNIVFVYFSDHGEEVFDTLPRNGHAGSSKSISVYEIPFFIKISTDYKKFLVKNNLLKIEIHRPYQTDNLIHTLINLATIQTRFYEPSKSIVSLNFKAIDRFIQNKKYNFYRGVITGKRKERKN